MKKLALVLFSSSMLFFAAGFGSSSDASNDAAAPATAVAADGDETETVTPSAAAARIDPACVEACVDSHIAACFKPGVDRFQCIQLWEEACRNRCTR